MSGWTGSRKEVLRSRFRERCVASFATFAGPPLNPTAQQPGGTAGAPASAEAEDQLRPAGLRRDQGVGHLHVLGGYHPEVRGELLPLYP